MLEEEQNILWDCARDPLAGDVTLQLERIAIRHATKRYSP
jgi:hypothetical protein